MTIYSQIARVNTSSSRQAKQPSIRMIQPTHIGYICLTGDTDILLSDGVSTQKIGSMSNDYEVMTYDTDKKESVPSKITNYHYCCCHCGCCHCGCCHCFFEIVPESVYQITTISGRSI